MNGTPGCVKCGTPMTIARFRCLNCDLAVEGTFETAPLARLSVEEQIFVTSFVREHGNIRRMEALFNISYPTVKNKLNAITRKLDAAISGPDTKSIVLDRLARGEITVAQALDLLDSCETGE